MHDLKRKASNGTAERAAKSRLFSLIAIHNNASDGTHPVFDVPRCPIRADGVKPSQTLSKSALYLCTSRISRTSIQNCASPWSHRFCCRCTKRNHFDESSRGGARTFSGYAVFGQPRRGGSQAIYRDPIHDFGFCNLTRKRSNTCRFRSLSFGPIWLKSALRFVSGNDAGEKLSFWLASSRVWIETLPSTVPLTYNDFQHWYIQGSKRFWWIFRIACCQRIWSSLWLCKPVDLRRLQLTSFFPFLDPGRWDASKALKLSLEVISKWNGCCVAFREECRRLGLTSWGLETKARELFPDKSWFVDGWSRFARGTCAWVD